MPKMGWKGFGKVGLAVAGVMLPQIAAAEQAIQAARKASGPEKRDKVLAAVTSSVALTEALSGHEIVDEALMAEGLSQINDGYVKVMKALRVADGAGEEPGV